MTSKDRWLLNISIWCYIRPTWRQYQNMCQNFTSDQLQVLSISIHWLSVNKTPQNNSNATIKLIYTEPANSVCRQRLLHTQEDCRFSSLICLRSQSLHWGWHFFLFVVLRFAKYFNFLPLGSPNLMTWDNATLVNSDTTTFAVLRLAEEVQQDGDCLRRKVLVKEGHTELSWYLILGIQ